MNKKVRIILVIVLSLFIIIQFIPVDRTNPKSDVNLKISAPPEVMSILQKSCFDCHSNETNWPVYSYIAPVSWLVAGHVTEGRENLNFSEWGKIPLEKLQRKKNHIWDEIEEGKMPLPSYLNLHGDAELTDSDKQIIKEWTKNIIQNDEKENE